MIEDAPVWHYWIGLILLLLALGGVAGLVFGYLKMVSARRYPPARREVEQRS